MQSLQMETNSKRLFITLKSNYKVILIFNFFWKLKRGNQQ